MLSFYRAFGSGACENLCVDTEPVNRLVDIDFFVEGVARDNSQTSYREFGLVLHETYIDYVLLKCCP